MVLIESRKKKRGGRRDESDGTISRGGGGRVVLDILQMEKKEGEKRNASTPISPKKKEGRGIDDLFGEGVRDRT